METVKTHLIEKTKLLKDNSIDVISLFHVLGHLDDPISILSLCYQKLKKNGILIIESPNANDIFQGRWNDLSMLLLIAKSWNVLISL